MGRKHISGLRLRNGIWHINGKRICKRTIYESTGTGSLEEAEKYLARRTEQIRQEQIYGVRLQRTFREAATKYLETNMHLASIADSARHIEQLDPFIGHLPLDHIHDGTLEPFKQARRAAGRKAKSINLALQVVRRVLNLAARKWRDGNVSWLETAPLLSMEPLIDQRKPYPLSFDEQGKLFQALPEHLAVMALYKVNTGLRQQEVCWLSWDWETRVRGIGFVFILPGAPDPVIGWPGVKNRQDRVVVHNEAAADVIEAQRGKHETWVFPYRGRRVTRMNNSAWRRARDKAGLPVRVHDLKHTFGRRLRSAGVALETRKVLLGHSNGDITVHYSQPELRELLRAVRRVDQARRDNVVLLRVGQNSGTQMANGRS